MDRTNKKNAHIIMITGGQRSGKSLFAEQLALRLSDSPVYLATARVFDDEMLKRVGIHKERRKEKWRNIEEPFKLSSVRFSENEVVLIDCLTLWATNWFLENNNIDSSLSIMKEELEILFQQRLTLIIVTNEIGLGGISDNILQRNFTDLQGLINQYVASEADEVYFTVSGIPITIKKNTNNEIQYTGY